MHRPLPREWLLSGESRLRRFDPKDIIRCIDCLRPANFRATIVSRDATGGKWDKKEKWYGTEYSIGPLPGDLVAEVDKAYNIATKDRIPELRLPHRNQFIPTKLEVEKKDIKEPATAPRLIRNDALAQTWFKRTTPSGCPRRISSWA